MRLLHSIKAVAVRTVFVLAIGVAFVFTPASFVLAQAGPGGGDPVPCGKSNAIGDACKLSDIPTLIGNAIGTVMMAVFLFVIPVTLAVLGLKLAKSGDRPDERAKVKRYFASVVIGTLLLATGFFWCSLLQLFGVESNITRFLPNCPAPRTTSFLFQKAYAQEEDPLIVTLEADPADVPIGTDPAGGPLITDFEADPTENYGNEGTRAGAGRVGVMGSSTQGDASAHGGGGTIPGASKMNDAYAIFLLMIRIFMRYVILPALIMVWAYTGFRFVWARGRPEELLKAKLFALWAAIGTAILIGAETIAFMLRGTVESIFS